MNRREFIVGATAAGVMSGAFAKEGPAGLRIRFLGTGASDWKGLDERGEWRRWSSILVDNAVLVDFTAQSVDQLPAGVRPEAIFYTHSHRDHYDPAEAGELGVAVPAVRGLAFGETVEERGVRFTCVPANHGTSRTGERAGMFLIEKGEERLLYATDTGGIMAEAARIVGIDAHMRDGKPITALVMEATMGVGYEDDFRIYTHSSVDTVARIVRVLTATGRYLPPPGRKVYLTHLARTLHGTHAEVAAAVPAPLCPAHDGLEVVFGK